MRLPRLYAPAEAQLLKVQFAQSDAWQSQVQTPTALFDAVADWLAQEIKARPVQLHAWSLTPEALLMLATPPDSDALSGLVQSIGRRLGATLRSGGVFAGRYKSALVESDRVLATQIWVEQAPQRNGYVANAVDWAWSSAGLHTGIVPVPRPWVMPLTDHPGYWGCGNTPFARQAAYQAKLTAGLSNTDRRDIEAAVAGQWALGSEAYLAKISKLASRRVKPGKRGRPAKLNPNDMARIRP